MTQLTATTEQQADKTEIFSDDNVKNMLDSGTQWLKDRRNTAWDIFKDTPMPTSSDEAWRRTNLRKVKWNRFKLDVTSSVEQTENLADLPQNIGDAVGAGHPAAGRIVIINNRIVYKEIDPEIAAQGVIFTSLASAAMEQPELVQKYLGAEAVPASNDKFAAYNSALWQEGFFLYVPKNVEVEHPFQAAIILDGEAATSLPRTLIIAERFANLTYIEETVSNSTHKQALNVGVTEIYADDSAKIRHVDIQNWGDDVYNFNVKRSIGQNNSKVIWETGQLGGRLTKTYYDSILPGDGAEMEFNGAYFMQGKQHVDIDCLIHHIGKSTIGDLLLHGAVKNKGRSVFTGLIKIDETGQLTDSYLKNENLLLDSTARADSIPSLEIDAHDVRASHGATLGKIDEEYIFYLMSRGIDRKMAVRMVVEGFFHKVFDRMHNEHVREKLFQAVSAKIGS